MLEITCIKGIAALHRIAVNLSVRTIRLRERLAISRYNFAKEVAAKHSVHADAMKIRADHRYCNSIMKIRAAEHTVLNLRDDLNKIT